MGNYNRDDRRGGNRGGFRGGNRFGGGDFGRPQMHQATCATCGKPCEVPFRPSGDRPIYCKEHFHKDRDNDFRGGDNRDRSRNQTGGNVDLKNQLQSLQTKLDRIIELLLSGNKAQVVKDNVKIGKETPLHTVKKVSGKKIGVKKAANKKSTSKKK